MIDDDALLGRLIAALGVLPPDRIAEARERHADRPLLDALRAEQLLPDPVLDALREVAAGAGTRVEEAESTLRGVASVGTLHDGAFADLLKSVARDLADPNHAAHQKPAPRLASGQTFGRFAIEAVLGMGGMGIVYRAFDPSLQRSIALKVIQRRSELEDEGDAFARFAREARAAASLSHVNLVCVHEVGEVDGVPFYTQELVDGVGLDRILTRRHLSPEEALRLVQAAARGLSEAHAKGILHRDVKPGNVIVSEDLRTVKVTDFGLARRIRTKGETVTGAVLGTPHYMAPEQVGGSSEDLDARTDVYGLGAVLYECLTHRRPFPGTDVLDVLARVRRDEPPAPRDVERRVPEEVEWICLRCLEKDRERRYPSAEALATDIDRYLTGRPIEARPASMAYRLRKRVRRNPWAWGFAVCTLLAAFTALVALTLQGRRFGLQSRADELAHQAEVAYAAGDLDQARRAAEEAVRVDGLHVAGRHWLARLRLRAYVEARGLPLARIRAGWVQAIPPRPETPALRVDRERTRSALAGTPGDALAEGMFLLADGNAAEALAILSGIGNDLPGSWEARLGEGQALYQLARFEEAEERLAPLAGLDPRIVGPVAGQVAIARGLAAHLAGEEAVGWFAQAEAMGRRMDAAGLSAPGRELWARALVAWGRTGFERGRPPDERYARALAVLEGLEDLDAEIARGEVLLAQAETLAARGKLNLASPSEVAAAIEALDRAIALDPRHPVALLLQAEAHRARWDYGHRVGTNAPWEDVRRSRDHYAQAVEESPDLVEAAVGLAWATAELHRSSQGPPGEWAAALEEEERTLTVLLEARPDSPPLLAARATVRSHKAMARGLQGEEFQRDFDGALADLTRAAEVNPSFAWALWQRGGAHRDVASCLRRRGQDPVPELRAAIEDFGRAIEVDPFLGEALSDRGYARQDIAAQRHRTGEDPLEEYRRAIDDFEEALRINPLLVAAWEGKGLARYNQATYLSEHGRDALSAYEESISDLTRAMGINPASSDAAIERGNARTNLGMYLDRIGQDPEAAFLAAMDDYAQALRCAPELVDALARQGHTRGLHARLRFRRGEEPWDEYETAIADLSRAVQLDPENLEALRSRAGVRRNLGYARKVRGQDPTEHYQAAIDDFTRILARTPKSAETCVGRGLAYQNLAMYLWEQGRLGREEFEKAVADHRAALGVRGNDAETWRLLGVAQRGLSFYESGDQRHVEEALASLTKAIELEADGWEAYKDRGRIWLDLEKGAEALEDYTRAVELHPASKGELSKFIERARTLKGSEK